MTYDRLKSLIERRGVHAEFGPAGEGWGIEQNPHELACFLMDMAMLDVRSVLEVGTGYRAGFSRFLRQDMGWSVTTLDIVDRPVAGGVEFVRLPHDASLEALERDVEIETFVRQRFAPRSFDLVFIDGDHAYESVWRDHLLYAPLARKVVAFHDIAGLRQCEGVKRFWSELETDNVVLIEPSPRAAGIGWYAVK